MSSRPVTLVSIPASNYVEKARWALQLAKIPFAEDKHVPIFHRFTTQPMGGTSVPLVSFADSNILLRNSSDILDFCAESEPSLYPNENVKQRELNYDNDLGPATRVVGYWFAFKSWSLVRKVIVSTASSRLERVLGFILLPLIRVFLFWFMSINEASVAVAIGQIESTVREACLQLGDGPVGSRFLAGDSFSAADISFCAHFGLVLTPPENKYLEPYWKEIGNHPLRARIEALHQSKAADFVRWCYKHKRPPML